MFEAAMVYLGAALIAVPLATKLGFGTVLGYILAGVLIGPSVFGLVGDQTKVMHVAEFGVVLMLFLIGLELEPKRLWRMKHSILGLGGLQVVITTMALFVVVHWGLGLRVESALAIGLMLALSSTAIALQTLTEKGWLRLEGGQNSFSVLLFQDIAIIPIMALMPLLAFMDAPHDSGHGASIIEHLSLWAQVSVSCLAIVGIIAAGKLLVNPIFRFIAELRLREAFTIFALFIVVAIAGLMTSIGLSPALGTFLAGVVLAESTFRHELEADIAPFKGLLLGLFFITVGAAIDFNLLVERPALIMGLVAGLFAIKMVILAGLAYAFRISGLQKVLFILALCQGGEFAFVLLSVTDSLYILTETEAAITTLVVAISMLLSPLLMLLYGALERRVLTTSQGAAGTAPTGTEDIRPSDKVILAGYGRFGQIVGRFLMAQGVDVSILEQSPSQIELVRKFGFTVYYGDVARYDVLAAAGAEKAKLLVLAIKNIDKTLEIVDYCQKHYPHLKIAARAVDRRHTYELMRRNVDIIKRETFSSSLELGVESLKTLGMNADTAERAARIFKTHDEDTIRELSELWGDDKNYSLAFKKRQEVLLQVLARDHGERSKDEKNDGDAMDAPSSSR